MLRNTGKGSLVQLVDDKDGVINCPYITQAQHIFFQEERPGMIINSFKQGQVVYYKVMLAYTGDIIVGIPEYLLKDNELVL